MQNSLAGIYMYAVFGLKAFGCQPVAPSGDGQPSTGAPPVVGRSPVFSTPLRVTVSGPPQVTDFANGTAERNFPVIRSSVYTYPSLLAWTTALGVCPPRTTSMTWCSAIVSKSQGSIARYWWYHFIFPESTSRATADMEYRTTPRRMSAIQGSGLPVPT